MYEKVNPSHPDKIADRVAGAIVDLAYTKEDNPKVAVEVLIGHGVIHIINETSVHNSKKEIKAIVKRLCGDIKLDYKEVKQDVFLAHNQADNIRCGDNGIFKGTPVTAEQKKLTKIAKDIYKQYPYDGKYLINKGKLTLCQSNCKSLPYTATFNPLGYWTGGTTVDSGATNRKLGSDMGDGVTGGGLHGKDLSKADVSINIYCFIRAQKLKKPVELSCNIGDDMVDERPYSEIVDIARKYIKSIGGFEKFAEWGLIR